MGHLLWAVFLDREDEMRWHATLGRADVYDWCAAHGWHADRIASGSVNIYAYRDRHVEVAAEGYLRGPDGEDLVKTRTVVSPLRRSLPEGIGTVIR